MEEGFFVRCISFHNDKVSLSVEVSDSEGKYYQGASALFQWITKQKGLIAHNSQFETGVLFAMTGKYVPHKVCTYMMLRRLAGEGSPGQSWGLKPSARELLGWEDWSADIPKSAAMAYLPFEKLGRYNQIDSAATWELYQTCCRAIDRHQDTWGKFFWGFIQEDIQAQMEQQFEAYTNGLRLDVPYTENYNNQVLKKIDEMEAGILNHENIAYWIMRYNQAVVDKAVAETNNYNKKLKKDGTITKNYQKKLDWLEKIKTENHFNLNSPKQLQYLLYDCLEVEPRLLTDKGEPSTKKAALKEIPIYGKLILDYRNQINQYKFLRACLDNTKNEELRINVKIPGTLTGRCSSGSPE